MENLSTLQIIGGGVMAVLSLFGVGNIVKMVIERFWKKKDDDQHASETNQGKLIDADQLALKMLYDELQDLKKKVDTLTTELAAVKDERSDLRAENKILKANEENLKGRVDRQGKRIDELDKQLQLTKDLLTEAKTAISHRENEIVVLRAELTETTRSLNELKRKEADFEAKVEATT